MAMTPEELAELTKLQKIGKNLTEEQQNARYSGLSSRIQQARLNSGDTPEEAQRAVEEFHHGESRRSAENARNQQRRANDRSL